MYETKRNYTKGKKEERIGEMNKQKQMKKMRERDLQIKKSAMKKNEWKKIEKERRWKNGRKKIEKEIKRRWKMRERDNGKMRERHLKKERKMY